MPPPEQRGAEGHEICDGVLAIADPLVQDTGDESDGLSMIQTYASCEATLGEVAEVREGELVDLGVLVLSVS